MRNIMCNKDTLKSEVESNELSVTVIEYSFFVYFYFLKSVILPLLKYI